MKKILKCLLVLAVVASFIPSAQAGTYGEALLDRKYREAIDAGCDDIIVKDTGTATLMGLLPGGGSFYTGEVAMGVVDLLLWPISPIWDMPMANNNAHMINKRETVAVCKYEGKI